MSVRKTIKWFLLIVVVIGLIGGAYGYWMWSNANRMLLNSVREKLAEKVPDWNVTVGAARFDWHRRIHLYDLTLKSNDGKATLVHIPEAILTVDREKLAELQIVDIQRIQIRQPDIHLVRDPQGLWNWEKLPPPRKPDKPLPLPEWIIEEATIDVRLQRSGGAEDTAFTLRQSECKLVPAARREFLFKGSTLLREAGTLRVSGRWNLDNKSWMVDGRMQDVQARGELLGLAVGSSAELRKTVSRLEAALRRITPPDERPDVSVDNDAFPNLGASATLDIGFHFEQATPAGEPLFDIHARFRQGSVENAALPFPLNDVAGSVHWSNDRVEFKNVTAENGSTRLRADGVIERLGSATPCRINVSANNLPLQQSVKERLPPRWRKLYDTIRPQGRVDISGELTFDGVDKWTPADFVLTAKSCSFSHAKFPYRFTNVSGTVTQTARRLNVRLRGRAGRRPALLTGVVVNPGPTAATRYDLYVDDLALDESLRAACSPDVRQTLRELNLSGAADVHFHASQQAGEDRTPHIRITADLTQCALEYEKFPYRLDRLTGRAAFDSKTDTWTFSNLQAFNGNSKLTGSGTLVKNDERPALALTVRGKQVYFDKALYRALPEHLQKLWRELSPTGEVDLHVELNWRKGEPLAIEIPEATVTKGGMRVKSFPYAFTDITAKFAYASGVLRILSFVAQHERTQVRASGFAETFSDGEWRLRLIKFLADDLVPDRPFRQSLKGKLREIVEDLDPRGPVSISGMLEFRGTGNEEDSVTAAWDLKLVLSGNSLVVGPKLTNLHGDVRLKGTWDGETVDMRRSGNRFDLDSLTVRGYQFTQVRGPFRLYDKQLVVGSADVFRRRKQRQPRPRIDAKHRVTAKAVGGDFTLDAVVLFDKQPTYQLQLTMTRGDLRRFAHRYLKGTKNLKGVMYGRLELAGTGRSTRKIVGRGELLISPAELYELPVLVQVFKVLNFVQPDKTAFTFAYADFDVVKRQFRFNTIDLVGDAINLRGRGTADFDGRLAIDFYSMLSRNRLPGFVLRQLVNSATTGWVGVEVRGTVQQPVARVRAVPQVEDALKQFLQGFGRWPTSRVPIRRPIPRRGSQ